MLQEDLFEKIEKEPLETCLYKKIFLDYTYGAWQNIHPGRD